LLIFLSVALVIMTLPFSLFVCFKVRNALKKVYPYVPLIA